MSATTADLTAVLDLLDTAHSRLFDLTADEPEGDELAELRRTLGLLTMDLEAVLGARGVRS